MRTFLWILKCLIPATFVLVLALIAYRTPPSTAPRIEVGKTGPYRMIFEEIRGPYTQTAVAIDQVRKWSRTSGVRCVKTFGKYYHDSHITPDEALRSEAGCIIEANTSIPALPAGFREGKLDEQKRLTLSSSHDLPKAYGLAASWLNRHGYVFEFPSVEIYDSTDEVQILLNLVPKRQEASVRPSHD